MAEKHAHEFDLVKLIAGIVDERLQKSPLSSKASAGGAVETSVRDIGGRRPVDHRKRDQRRRSRGEKNRQANNRDAELPSRVGWKRGLASSLPPPSASASPGRAGWALEAGAREAARWFRCGRPGRREAGAAPFGAGRGVEQTVPG